MNKLLISIILSFLLFLILTVTPLFTNLTGHKLDNNIIVIQSIIFGIMIYVILGLKEKKPESEDKSENKLDAFDVGGSHTCK